MSCSGFTILAGTLADPVRGLVGGPFRISVEDGSISSVDRIPADPGLSRLVASPGLVQSHIHLCQTLFRGMAGRRTLLPWLEERIWPLEAAHTADTLAVSAITGLSELIRSGCTALVDMGSVEGSSVTVDILRRSGMRAAAANSLMDRGPQCMAREPGWLAEESARVRSACGGSVEWAVAPRFALSCSDAVWEFAAGFPRSVPRTTHASEALEEVSSPEIASEGGNIRFLERRGFLGPRTLVAHCIHLEPGEAELMAASGAAAVHCPAANLRLGSGIADVAALESAGVRVATGSDGAACSDCLDPASAARLGMGLMAAVAGPGAVDPRRWLASMTTTPSGVLGWRTGRLEPGMAADVAVLELSPDEAEVLWTAEDPLGILLDVHWPSRVMHTVAGGRYLMRDRELLTLPPLPASLAGARETVLARAGLGEGV